MTDWLQLYRARQGDASAEAVTIGTIGDNSSPRRPAGVEPAPSVDPIVPIVPIVTEPADQDRDPERAAIIEYGSGVPREWAEGYARLLAGPVPAGVGASEWAAVLDAAGRFLDMWGRKAHALGWTAAELFGLDPAAPLNRLDRRGAAFLLARSEVVAITASELTIRANGHLQRVPKRGLTSSAFGG